MAENLRCTNLGVAAGTGMPSHRRGEQGTPSSVWRLCLVSAVAIVWSIATPANAEGRWQQVENQPNCTVWNAAPQPNETVLWTGGCVNGIAQGNGMKVWRYLVEETWKENRYTGAIKEGLPHGRGTYIWADGNRYEGDWQNGSPHGRGVYVWGYGDRYSGGYKAGRPNGRGTFTSADGQSYSGSWRNGCFKNGKRRATVGTTRKACGF